MALSAVLVSPEFLFRVEPDPAGVPPNTAYRVSDLELASRLSFFLWSSIPDDELLDVAIAGKLREPAVLERQVRRMLADSRSRALVEQLRLAVAAPAQSRRDHSGHASVPGLRRQSPAGLPAGDGALLRQHPARGSERARSVARELHVRQRTAGEALRHPARVWQPLPAHDARRRQLARRDCFATEAS